MTLPGIVEAMELIATEGMLVSDFKKKRIKDKIRKDAKHYKWNKESVRMLDGEWQWRICLARMQLGYLDYEGWNYRAPRDGMIPTRYPMYTLDDFKNGVKAKKLLVLGEQGIGDEVQYASCFNRLGEIADECAIECYDRLAPIFKRSFHWEFISRVEYNEAPWDDGSFTHQIFLADLCKLFRTHPGEFENTPYLIPDPRLVEKWKKELPNVFKAVALTWKGRQGAIDPEIIKQDMKLNINLQYGLENGRDWMWTPECDGEKLDLTNDIDDVFAILSLCEKVVGIPNSLIHFASALGVKSEVIMTPYKGEQFNALNWRWGMGDKTPWVPHAKLYRTEDAYIRRIQKAE